MKRFSINAFVLGMLLHLLGTALLAWVGLRMLFADIFASTPLWLNAFCWMWAPLPMFLQRYVSDIVQYPQYQFYYLALWSLCVGCIIGFLLPRQYLLRHQKV